MTEYIYILTTDEHNIMINPTKVKGSAISVTSSK